MFSVEFRRILIESVSINRIQLNHKDVVKKIRHKIKKCM